MGAAALPVIAAIAGVGATAGAALQIRESQQAARETRRAGRAQEAAQGRLLEEERSRRDQEQERRRRAAARLAQQQGSGVAPRRDVFTSPLGIAPGGGAGGQARGTGTLLGL